MEQQIQIQLPEPHSEQQRVLINFAFNPHCKELIVCCGTKWGKTAGSSNMVSRAVLERPQSLWRWVAPIYSQSRIGYKYITRMLPSDQYDARKAPPIIEFQNGSEIQFFHGQNAESLEGEACHGNLFDEAAKLEEEVYISGYTTTTQTKGKNVLISTPRGKNWFYKKAMAAMEEMLRARHEGRHPTKLFITAPTASNPYVPRESIEEARRNLPARLFEQYYLAKFIDDGMVFNQLRQCLYGPVIEVYGQHERWCVSDSKERTVVIGVDWAKTHDKTVFVAIDPETRQVVAFERFYKKPYTEAIRLLVQFSLRFKTVDLVVHDKTGVGQAIDDQLAYTDLNYRGFTFSNSSKTEAVNRLITTQEQGGLFLPRWQPLINEFESFEVTTNKLGNMMFSAPSGQHDDIVCAVLLAHIAMLEYTETADPMVRFLEDLPRDKVIGEPSTIEEYYGQMIADSDEDDD